jgi:hypothetical protein
LKIGVAPQKAAPIFSSRIAFKPVACRDLAESAALRTDQKNVDIVKFLRSAILHLKKLIV